MAEHICELSRHLRWHSIRLRSSISHNKATLEWLSAFRLKSAGASGVGSAAIQIAKDIGATVFVTSSSSEKLDFCKVTDMVSELP